MRPDPFELFIRYHLGLDGDLRSKFYNLTSLAREYDVGPEEIGDWLSEARLSSDISGHVDFKLAEAHGEAQILAITGTQEEVRAFALRTFEGYRASLGTYDPKTFRHGTDWDNVWGDDEPGTSEK